MEGSAGKTVDFEMTVTEDGEDDGNNSEQVIFSEIQITSRLLSNDTSGFFCYECLKRMRGVEKRGRVSEK